MCLTRHSVGTLSHHLSCWPLLLVEGVPSTIWDIDVERTHRTFGAGRGGRVLRACLHGWLWQLLATGKLGWKGSKHRHGNMLEWKGLQQKQYRGSRAAHMGYSALFSAAEGSEATWNRQKWSTCCFPTAVALNLPSGGQERGCLFSSVILGCSVGVLDPDCLLTTLPRMSLGWPCP